MNYGHVTGDKREQASSQAWYDEIQAAHLRRLEDEAHATAQALAAQIKTEAEAKDLQPVALPTHSEAPCSVNVKFTAEGMQAQATGRGATPEEAVSNLQNTIAKTIVALGTPPPMNRYEKLGRLVTCGLQKAQNDPKLTERFLKAVQLVTCGHVVALASTEMYKVKSQTEDKHYDVNATRCPCADRRKHEDEADYKCKHILAVLLTVKLEGLA